MPLIVTPPVGVASLWQSVCRDHGVVIHAVRQHVAVMAARLHDHQHDDGCALAVGGLRCMFCLRVVEVKAWPREEPVPCFRCWSDAINGRMPADQSVHPVSQFVTWTIRPRGVSARGVLEDAHGFH